MTVHRRRQTARAALGFTIVELAIVMVMSGLALSMLTMLYITYAQSRALVVTQEKLDDLSIAYALFYSSRSRYPCPSDPNLSVNSANFGREIANCTVGGLGPVGGTGVIRAAAGRDANNNGLADDYVLIGGVPFNSLRDGIESDICYSRTTGGVVACGAPDAFNPSEGTIDTINMEKITDSWGRLMTYAVTQSQTRNDTYAAAGGGIAIVTENIGGASRPLTSPPSSAHFVILSHGDDGAGGRDRNGILHDVCPAGSPDELENCNNDATFVSGLRRLGAGAGHFDDVVFFSAFTMSELWKNSQSDTIYNVNQSGNVGIGITNPLERLHVAGDVKATALRGDWICNNTGATGAREDCFPPDLLSGANPCMKCPLVGCVTASGPIANTPALPGPNWRWGVTGIRRGHALCAAFQAPLSSYLLGKTCPIGQFMVGVRYEPSVMPPADGVTLICVPSP